jgi:malate/lactate dehydrogenase
MNPQVSHLSLYDIGGTKGVAADVSHINSRAIAQVRTWAPGGVIDGFNSN